EPLPTVQLMLANSGHYLVNPAVTITSVMLRMLSGTFVLKGTLSGSTQTLAWDADGLYQGVLSTNQTTGSWSKLLDIPVGTSRDTHVITVYEVAHPTVKASYTVTY
ncbi:MAG: hypothetical protein ACRYHQ_04015, partial [Janthinobacterium lividum]